MSERVLVLPMVTDHGEVVYRYANGISSGAPKYFEFCTRWRHGLTPIKVVSAWIRYPDLVSRNSWPNVIGPSTGKS